MTPSEIEAALTEAFTQCEAALDSLSDRQKQILRQTILAALSFGPDRRLDNNRIDTVADDSEAEPNNPLAQLTAEERQIFLAFVEAQERQNKPWKIALLNDWLSGRSSGAVQFIRERYGLQWIEQITPIHLASYIHLESDNALRLKVGDRIEVTNGLWEWVQEAGPCSREWFPCTVVSIKSTPQGGSDVSEASRLETSDNEAPDSSEESCVIRFEGGTEYEIQGVYDWNRPNWRWP